jgi:hypothetical protein
MGTAQRQPSIAALMLYKPERPSGSSIYAPARLTTEGYPVGQLLQRTEVLCGQSANLDMGADSGPLMDKPAP